MILSFSLVRINSILLFHFPLSFPSPTPPPPLNAHKHKRKHTRTRFSFFINFSLSRILSLCHVDWCWRPRISSAVYWIVVSVTWCLHYPFSLSSVSIFSLPSSSSSSCSSSSFSWSSSRTTHTKHTHPPAIRFFLVFTLPHSLTLSHVDWCWSPRIQGSAQHSYFFLSPS